MTDMLDVKPRK